MAIRVNPKQKETGIDFRRAVARVLALAEEAIAADAAESRSGQPDPDDENAIDQVSDAFGWDR